MFRLVLRLFLLAYFLMPVIAGGLIIYTVLQVRDDITTVYENASERIADATSGLTTELRDLGDKFQPLANAVNGIRSALVTVRNFLQNTVFTVIDVVNNINVACSIGGRACIPKSFNITIPALLDLSFIDNISDHITEITDEVGAVVSTTTRTITDYAVMLALAVALVVVWMLLSSVLFYVVIYTSLWRA
jgi:methyl-accepting chemotaxis protein